MGLEMQWKHFYLPCLQVESALFQQSNGQSKNVYQKRNLQDSDYSDVQGSKVLIIVF